MAVVDEKVKEINAKIVYYGPGLSGKTTNINYIYRKLKPEHRGKLTVLATKTDRTLFFDFLPIELGEIRGMKTRFQVYTVPGQVYYNATRKLVLKNVDGIVFVADSSPDKLAQNVESLNNLEENLAFYKRRLQDIPHVIQYNKRDVEGALPVEELQKVLNRYNAPYFEASAKTGKGVLETLTLICKMVLKKLRSSPEFMRVQQVPSEEMAHVERKEEERETPVESYSKIMVTAGDVGFGGNGEIIVPIYIKDEGGKILKEMTLSLSISLKEKEREERDV